jgi:hypothetical protein
MTGDTLYAWQVLEDGAWGNILAAVIPGVSPTVLVARNLETAHRIGLFAVAHHDTTGLPVRCVRFDNPTVIREMP